MMIFSQLHINCIKKCIDSIRKKEEKRGKEKTIKTGKNSKTESGAEFTAKSYLDK